MSADSPPEQNETLHRLADALGIAPKAFLDGTASNLSQTMELLRLWQGVADEQVRAKVLAIVEMAVQVSA